MTSLAGLDEHIERIRADWGNVGVAVALVEGSRVAYAKGFGVKQFDEPVRIDAATLFQVGSTTKAFTAAAIGTLVDEGRVRWDDPISEHLPGFQVQDCWLTRHLTIRDAVAHRSGISHSYYPFLGIMNAEDAVGLLRYLQPEGRYRDSFVYSNLMYGAVGQLIHAVTGRTWHEFVKERLLVPLDMSRSRTSAGDLWDSRHIAPTFLGSAPAGDVDVADAHDSNVALPHGCAENGAVVGLPWRSYDNAAAAGSIVSSALDMSNWAMLHLNGGCFKGRRLLSVQTMQELHAAQNSHGGPLQFPFEQEPASYAMGWWRTRYRGHDYLVHGGGVVGFPAYVALLPTSKIGIVVLANGSRLSPNGASFHKAIALSALDRLLGSPARDWHQEFLQQALSEQGKAQDAEAALTRGRLRVDLASLPFERYVGTYADQRRHSGTVNVHVDNGRLLMSFAGAGAFSAHLEHWHRDVFRLYAKAGVADVLGPQFAAFALDAGGTVSSMSAFASTFHRV